MPGYPQKLYIDTSSEDQITLEVTDRGFIARGLFGDQSLGFSNATIVNPLRYIAFY
jgi:hypothetical protein